MPSASLLAARLSGAPKARIEHWLSCGKLFFPVCPSDVEAEAAATLLLFYVSVVVMCHLLHNLALGTLCKLRQVCMLFGRCL